MSASWPVENVNNGPEVLFGSVVNPHLAYLGQQLFSLGLRVDRQTTVPDGLAIADVVREATSRSQLVIITGGVGATSDHVRRERGGALTRGTLRCGENVFARTQAQQV